MLYKDLTPYFFITLLVVLSTSCLYAQKPQWSIQRLLSSAQATIQRNKITSVFIALGGCYAAAEAITKYRKQTSLTRRSAQNLHDVAYWIFKKIVCLRPCIKQEVLRLPE